MMYGIYARQIVTSFPLTVKPRNQKSTTLIEYDFQYNINLNIHAFHTSRDLQSKCMFNSSHTSMAKVQYSSKMV